MYSSSRTGELVSNVTLQHEVVAGVKRPTRAALTRRKLSGSCANKPLSERGTEMERVRVREQEARNKKKNTDREVSRSYSDNSAR
jgi:hypothetical protein